MAEKPDDVLAGARKFLQECSAADSENWRDGKDDLLFILGGDNQWRPEDLHQRRIDGRPWMTTNKLPTFLHQVTNSLRQNRPGIKIHPVGGSADTESAKVRQGLIRHIEYDSNADVAYDRAVCSAAAIGYGYFGIYTDYCTPESFDQEIRFRSIRNPFTVKFDPLSTEPDGSDARRVLIMSRMPKDVFKREYPTAQACSITDITSDLREWFTDDAIVIAEYYTIEETAATLCQMPDGTTAWKDELQTPMVPIAERKSYKRKVMLRKITGCDVLEETEVKCYWIPVFPVYGDEVDVDGKVYRSGLIRNAKDPARLYNYWQTSAAEEVALRPKTPYIGAVGQFENLEQDWKDSNRRSFPFLQYNPVTVDGVMAPAPQRQPMADIPSGMMQLMMHANDNIKATTGLFDASLGARGNATSGKQELAQQRQGDISNFHYVDGLTRTIRHVGRCINWMIPHYYDTERIVQIMRPDDTVSHETINQQKVNPFTLAVESVLNDMRGGEYSVTVSAGASYSTLRQEAVDNMTEIASRDPGFLQIAGDVFFKEQDWPGADKIAARYRKIIDPKLTEGEEGGEGLEQRAQQVAQAQKMLEQQSMEIEQKTQMLMQAEEEIKAEADKVGQDKAEVKAELSRIDAEKQILQAQYKQIRAELKAVELQAKLDANEREQALRDVAASMVSEQPLTGEGNGY